MRPHPIFYLLSRSAPLSPPSRQTLALVDEQMTAFMRDMERDVEREKGMIDKCLRDMVDRAEEFLAAHMTLTNYQELWDSQVNPPPSFPAFSLPTLPPAFFQLLVFHVSITCSIDSVHFAIPVSSLPLPFPGLCQALSTTGGRKFSDGRRRDCPGHVRIGRSAR